LILAWRAPPCQPRLAGIGLMTTIRHQANALQSRGRLQKNEIGSDNEPSQRELIRRSVQEIRRIAVRLSLRQINPAHVIAWSIWRRAHQAIARQAHLETQL
ncbi:MAG TPA: hypothetical protein PKD21_06995, partial [Candidatus Competibacter phosphatis]|nr:hypothetical protein [Candidatus Competibacter phosphatis]